MRNPIILSAVLALSVFYSAGAYADDTRDYTLQYDNQTGTDLKLFFNTRNAFCYTDPQVPSAPISTLMAPNTSSSWSFSTNCRDVYIVATTVTGSYGATFCRMTTDNSSGALEIEHVYPNQPYTCTEDNDRFIFSDNPDYHVVATGQTAF